MVDRGRGGEIRASGIDVAPGCQVPRNTLKLTSQRLPMASASHRGPSPPLFLLPLLLIAPAVAACLPPASILSSALPAGHRSLQLIWTSPSVWHIAHKHLVDGTDGPSAGSLACGWNKTRQISSGSQDVCNGDIRFWSHSLSNWDQHCLHGLPLGLCPITPVECRYREVQAL